MISSRLSRSAILMACTVLPVAGCAHYAGGPRVAAGPVWVGCSDTRRDNVDGGLALVQICAERDARFKLGSNAPQGGVQVARMYNSGPGVEKRWGLEVGQEYFVVITPGGPGPGGRWQITGPGSPSSPNRRGDYTQCTPIHGRPPTSSAKFGDCSDALAANGTHAKLDANGPGMFTLNTRSGPAWVSCETGCCTTEAASIASRDVPAPAGGLAGTRVASAVTKGSK